MKELKSKIVFSNDIKETKTPLLPNRRGVCFT